MAQINVGSLHSESFSVSVYQTGKNNVDIDLRNNLFTSDSSEWLCAVESLQIPLDETTYFDESPENRMLFNIHRLQDGRDWDRTHSYLYPEASQGHTYPTDMTGSAVVFTEDTVGTVRTNRSEIREWGDFQEMLTNWSIRFNHLMETTALTETGGFNFDWDQTVAVSADVTPAKKTFEHLRVRISPSGNFSFVMSKLFLSMFYITVHPYAQHIFGLPNIISYDLTQAVPTPRILIVDNLENNMMQAPTTYVIANNDWMEVFATSGTKSVWSSIDTRMAVSLTTDLQLKRNVIIVDEKEQRSYALGDYPLNNEVTITNTVSDQFLSSFSVTSQMRAGQLMVKRPTDPIVEWVSLANDIEVRKVRLRLALRQRKYLGDGKWTITIGDLPVADHTSWSCKLLFARRIH